jgi:hypothetical protein
VYSFTRFLLYFGGAPLASNGNHVINIQSTESKSVSNLDSAFKDFLSKYSDKTAAAIDKALKSQLKGIIKSSSPGSKNSDITKIDLQKVGEGIGKQFGAALVSNINKAVPQDRQKLKSVDNKEISDSIKKGISELSNKLTDVLSKRIASQTSIKVDEATLSKGIANILTKSLPKGSVDIPRDFSVAVNSLKAAAKDISSAANTINTISKSGGGVSTPELGDLYSSVRKLITDYKALSEESKKAQSAFAGLKDEFKDFPDLISKLNRSVGGVQRGATVTAKGITSQPQLNTKVLVKEITSSILHATRDVAPGFGDKKVEQSYHKMEQAVGNFDKFVNEFKNFKNTLKEGVASKNVPLEDVGKVIVKLDKLTSAIESIPKNLGTGIDKVPEVFKTMISGFEEIKKATSKVVKLLVDDTELDKIRNTVLKLKAKVEIVDSAKDLQDKLPTVELPVEIDIKGLEKSISNLSEKIKKILVGPFENSTSGSFFRQNIEPASSNLKKAVQSGDVSGMQAATQELSKQISRRFDEFYGEKKTSHQKDLQAQITDALNEVSRGIKALDVNIKRSFENSDRNRPRTLASRTPSHLIPSGPVDPTTRSPYKGVLVRPDPAGVISNRGPIPDNISKESRKLIADTYNNERSLSKSLYNLQKQIVTSIDKKFADSKSKWGVVSNPTDMQMDPTRAFKLTPGERQWTMQIANVAKLQKFTGDFGSSVDILVKNYKDMKAAEKTRQAAHGGGPDKLALLLGKWLKTVSSVQIQATEGLEPLDKERLVNIKDANFGVDVSKEMTNSIRNTFGDANLKDILRKTYSESAAKREMQKQGLVRNIAIPAAHESKTGELAFRTIHGAQRALPKFNTFETGFEVLTKQLEDKNKLNVSRTFHERIKEVGIRPGAGKKIEAETLSKEMLAARADAEGKGALDYLKNVYSKAAKGKGIELEKLSGGSDKELKQKFVSKVDTAIKTFESLADSKDTINAFVKKMEELNLTAYDAVRSLNKIKTEDVYQVMGRVLEGNKNISPIREVTKNPKYEQGVREFEKAVGEVEGLLPLLERNRPRRGYHQENVVNVMTRTGDFYKADKEDRLDPSSQKKLIKDLNLEFNDTLLRSEKRPRGMGNRKITSLGIPESAAGNVEEYRTAGGTGSFKYLKTLNATSVKMYAEDLTSMAPFGEFQQAGRNIANVTNAMLNINKDIETPKLRSEKERALVESGRYGKKGYGYNVTAELRNTAANFEDQILISGKLAEAMTSAVKDLVKPGPAGRVFSSSSEDRARNTGVSPMLFGEKSQVISGITDQDIAKASKKYMEILGMPEEYSGRADKALIDQVRNTVSVVRGEDVEIQQAKLAETFINYFGRKLTTRYGSKGVSLTPTGQPKNLAELLNENAKKTVKVDPNATLGYQVAPKSLGKLSSELLGDIATKSFDKDAAKELQTDLKKYGNKFMIDIFHDSNIVDAGEAEKTKELYKNFVLRWQEVFGEPAPELGTKGIKRIKEEYKNHPFPGGKQDLYEYKPIDVRISSYGAAKRGLQTEFLETAFSNLAGVGDEGVTTLKNLRKEDYTKLLGPKGQAGLLAKYSDALGYEGPEKSAKEIAPELFERFGGGKPEEYGAALKAGNDKALLAKRAAAIEAESSYYSTVIDEFGEKRKGLVGEKFLQIVEEPHRNPEWQRGQLERGMKGASLNIPAYSSYATVFGEESAIMKEVQSSLDINAKKHWEYMKALQTVQGKDSKIYENITKGLDTVDIKDVTPFYASTGVYGNSGIKDPETGEVMVNPRSFDGTILDISKFPQALKLAIPTGSLDASGKPKKEEFYIPGALARGTYPEPLIAGERGMDELTRRISHVTNMASELETLLTTPQDIIDFKQKIPEIIGTWLREARQKVDDRDPDAEQSAKDLVKRLGGALSDDPENLPDKRFKFTKPDLTEKKLMRKRLKTYLEDAEKGKRTKADAYLTAAGDMSDLLIGKTGKDASPDQMKAESALDKALSSGTAGSFEKSLGLDIVQDEIDRKIASLNKAKLDYYDTLAKNALGKTGSVGEIFFKRKIPAIMGKAVVAVADKSADLQKFEDKDSFYRRNLREI